MRAPKPASVSTPGLEATISRLIRKATMQVAEKKKFIFYGVNQSLGANFSAQYLLPQISQGTNDAQRIGNKIKLVSSKLDIFTNLLPYNATTNTPPPPLWVKMWVVKSKLANLNSFASTSYLTDWFSVNGANVGPQQNMLDMLLPINDDSWVLHDTRMFKLGITNALTTGPISTGAYLDNSDMSKHVSFDLTSYVHEVMYNDNATPPTNTNLFFVIQSVPADGSTTGIASAEYHFALDTRFIDL